MNALIVDASTPARPIGRSLGWPRLLLVALLSFATTAPASDWPMARGTPGLTGVAAGSLGTNLVSKWTFKTGDAIKGSPVIASGMVFVGSYDKKFYAVDLKSGEKRWEFTTEVAIESTISPSNSNLSMTCPMLINESFTAAVVQKTRFPV